MTQPRPWTILALALTAGLLATPAEAGGDHGHGGHGHGGHDDHGHAHADPHQGKAHHGGTVVAAGGRLFELLMGDEGIRVHPMDASGGHLSTEGLSGSVLLRARRGRRLSFDLKPVPGTGDEHGYLEVARDLHGVKDGSRTAILTIAGFGGEEDRSTVFTRFVRTHQPHGHHDDQGHGHEHGGHGHEH